MVEYANTPVDRTGGSPESSRSGESKVFRLVGLGFGLLCVMQLVLNVSLWRHTEGFFNKSDTNSSCSFTLMPCDDIRALMSERDHLLQENERLAEETRRLQNATSQLRERNRMLNEEVTKQQGHIQRLQTTRTDCKDQVDEEKHQLLHRNEHLLNEKAKLVAEKKQLLQENEGLTAKTTKLEEENVRLTEENKLLQEQLGAAALPPLNPPVRTCPLGWWRYMSSCYQLSTVASTWDCARLRCEDQGAHLVIVDGPGEAEIVRGLGRCLRVWTGLKCEPGPSDRVWKWVDGSVLSGANGIPLLNVCHEMNSCVFFDGRQPYSNFWFSGNCQSFNYWMCEMEL